MNKNMAKANGCKQRRRISIVARLVYLKIILPGHVSVDMAFGGPVQRSGLPLERGFGRVMIMGGRPLPLIHLDKIG